MDLGMKKKRERLGMNPSTARNRLIKTLLFKFVVNAGHKCYRCGKELSIDTFSVDHILPWLNSDDPIGLFFDVDNIAFSHMRCNTLVACHTRKGTTKYPEYNGYSDTRQPWQVAADKARVYDPEKRHQQYLRTGK